MMIFSHVRNSQSLVLFMGIIMLNFSVYLAEVDLLERLSANQHLSDCVDTIMLQTQAEEEEQHESSNESSESEEDLFVHDHFTKSHRLMMQLVTTRRTHSSPLYSTYALGIETPPPERG